MTTSTWGTFSIPVLPRPKPDAEQLDRAWSNAWSVVRSNRHAGMKFSIPFAGAKVGEELRIGEVEFEVRQGGWGSSGPRLFLWPVPGEPESGSRSLLDDNSFAPLPSINDILAKFPMPVTDPPARPVDEPRVDLRVGLPPVTPEPVARELARASMRSALDRHEPSLEGTCVLSWLYSVSGYTPNTTLGIFEGGLLWADENGDAWWRPTGRFLSYRCVSGSDVELPSQLSRPSTAKPASPEPPAEREWPES